MNLLKLSYDGTTFSNTKTLNHLLYSPCLSKSTLNQLSIMAYTNAIKKIKIFYL